MYSHSSAPRTMQTSTGVVKELVMTTKTAVPASKAFFEVLHQRTGVKVRSKRSRKMPPKPMPTRHKVDPFNNDPINPFTEMNSYLGYEELMAEEEDEELRADDRNAEEVAWTVKLTHDFQKPPSSRHAAKQPWTDQEAELQRVMGLQIRAGKTFGGDFFFDFFTTLRLYEAKIDKIDPAFALLSNLTELALCGNQIKVLENLPPSLQILNVQCNRINSLEGIEKLPALRHLGLSYNNVESVVDLGQAAGPELRSLDIAYNSLLDLSEVMVEVQQVMSLRNLVLSGNPLCMMPRFRISVVSQLPMLRWLDDVTISSNEREAAMATLLDVEKKRKERIEAREAAAAAAEEAAAEEAAAAAEEAAAAAEEAAAEEEAAAAEEESPPPDAEELDPDDELAIALAGDDEDLDPTGTGPKTQLLIVMNSVDGLHKLADPPEGVDSLMPAGPWMKEPVEGGEPPPPKPDLIHSLYVEGKIVLEHEVEEYSFRSKDILLEEAIGHVKLVGMKLSVDDFVPTVRARDALHSSGVEFHILRRTLFRHNPEYYAALPVPEVPEDASEEQKEALQGKADAIRSPPEDTHVDTLLRVGSSVLSSLAQGEDKLVLQTEMWEGKVVDIAKLDNWSIVFDNKKRMHSSEFYRASQSLRLQVYLNDPDEAEVVVEEPEEEIPEDPKAKKGKK